MKNKGFTLIELLAVIIVLAVLALISTPIVSSLIVTSQKGTYAKSIEGLVDAVKLDLGNNNFIKNREYLLDDDDNNLYLIIANGEVLEKREKIRVKGLVTGFARIKVDEDVDILVAAHNEKWCIKNSKSSSRLILSDYTGYCDLD